MEIVTRARTTSRMHSYQRGKHFFEYMQHHMHFKGNFVIKKNFENSSQANLIENVSQVINKAAKPCASVDLLSTVSKPANIDKFQQPTFMAVPGSPSISPEPQQTHIHEPSASVGSSSTVSKTAETAENFVIEKTLKIHQRQT